MTLSAQNINVTLGSRTILNETGVEALRASELTALIGPNAAGKLTLFRTIAGLVKSSDGIIDIAGEDLSQLSVQRRLQRICFMPQFFTANAALSVFDVVLMAQKQLSGGQAQMVSVCQALIRKAEVYLFDEPTSALDLRHQLDVMHRIKRVMKERGAIGIVALHDLNLAARYADHLLLIGSGQILAQGKPDAVLSDPLIAATYDVSIQTGLGPRKELNVHAYSD